MFVDGVIHCEKGTDKGEWVGVVCVAFEVLRVADGVYNHSR